MSKFDTYKDIIFSNEALKLQLIVDMRDKGYLAENFDAAYESLFHSTDNKDLQRILAPFLRLLAMARLRTSDAQRCQDFRNDITLGESTEAYLERQSRNTVFGTEHDAQALAEALGLNLYMTLTAQNCVPFKEGAFKGTMCLHKAIPETTDSVHLYNQVQGHYFVFEEAYYSTDPDGNCLYNGFAQHIQQFMVFERSALKKPFKSSDTSTKKTPLPEEFKLYETQLTTYEANKTLSPLSYEALVQVAAHTKNAPKIKPFDASNRAENKTCHLKKSTPPAPPASSDDMPREMKRPPAKNLTEEVAAHTKNAPKIKPFDASNRAENKACHLKKSTPPAPPASSDDMPREMKRPPAKNLTEERASPVDISNKKEVIIDIPVSPLEKEEAPVQPKKKVQFADSPIYYEASPVPAEANEVSTLFSMMLQYQAACQPLLLGLVLGAIVFAALSFMAMPLAISVGAAIGASLLTSTLSFFATSEKSDINIEKTGPLHTNIASNKR